MAPNNNPRKIKGEFTVRLAATTWCLYPGRDALVMKAPYKENETKAADPIANPFPIAAVQFPAASN